MDARHHAANVILDRGVRFRLPAPFYKRWLKKDYVTISHLKAGTILEISRVALESELEKALTIGGYELMTKAVEPCARCIAIAILNEKDLIEKKADRLSKQLLWEISAESLIDIFLKISVMNRMSDFTNITKYFLNRMMMMMNRKNLGHDVEGS